MRWSGLVRMELDWVLLGHLLGSYGRHRVNVYVCGKGFFCLWGSRVECSERLTLKVQVNRPVTHKVVLCFWMNPRTQVHEYWYLAIHSCSTRYRFSTLGWRIAS